MRRESLQIGVSEEATHDDVSEAIHARFSKSNLCEIYGRVPIIFFQTSLKEGEE